MQLNQTTLRGILAEILSVDENHVVPKQGNWWNPQSKTANVETWVGYRIRSNKPRATPSYYELEEGKNSLCVLKIAEIELQIVGKDSERIAQSLSTWTLRADVKEALAEVHGSIVYEDLTATSSDFYQDGRNTVVAWNVPNMKILWYDCYETSQNVLTQITLGGSVNGRI